MDAEIHFTDRFIAPLPCDRPLRETGAVVEFHGIVREMEGGARLDGLYYEAYEPMARREFARIFTELWARHSPQAVRIIHRLGFVPVGEASLFVHVESQHRGAALAFCGELIDRMKEDVPIWKSVRAPGSGSKAV